MERKGGKETKEKLSGSSKRKSEKELFLQLGTKKKKREWKEKSGLYSQGWGGVRGKKGFPLPEGKGR